MNGGTSVDCPAARQVEVDGFVEVTKQTVAAVRVGRMANAECAVAEGGCRDEILRGGVGHAGAGAN
jgi:hypothetical protein